MDGYRLIQSVCDWREENLEVIEDAENNLDYGKVPSYVAYERPADIGTTIIDELCASQGTAVEKLVNYPTTKFERTMRDELFEALAVNETTISLMAKVPSSVFLDAVACMDSRYMSGHTVDTGHAFIVSPGTYEPYIGIHDPVYGAGYMMVDLDKPFEIPMNRIWIAMDDYSGLRPRRVCAECTTAPKMSVPSATLSAVPSASRRLAMRNRNQQRAV